MKTALYSSLLIVVLFISCKKEDEKNFFEEGKKIIQTTQDDYKKYKLIFNSEFEENLTEYQSIELGKDFINLNMGWNKIGIDNNKLFQHSVVYIQNKTDIIFNKCFIDVYTTVYVDDKSFYSEYGYEFSFDNEGRTKIEIKQPIDNSFVLRKNRKYTHLDASYLEKEINKYEVTISIRAINDDERVFLKLYKENLSYMWNDRINYIESL